MQISLTGRQVEITDPLRTHIEKKLGKLDSYADYIIDVRVVLSVERYLKFAEITISARNNMRFHSREATDDMYASIDKAVEKIERQIRRHTTKRRRAKRRKEPENASQVVDSEEGDFEAEEAFETHGPYRVFLDDKIAPKPMSVKEAIMQLEVSEDQFLAFINEETDEVNIVFRKSGGDYGLLRRPY